MSKLFLETLSCNLYKLDKTWDNISFVISTVMQVNQYCYANITSQSCKWDGSKIRWGEEGKGEQTVRMKKNQSKDIEPKESSRIYLP